MSYQKNVSASFSATVKLEYSNYKVALKCFKFQGDFEFFIRIQVVIFLRPNLRFKYGGIIVLDVKFPKFDCTWLYGHRIYVKVCKNFKPCKKRNLYMYVIDCLFLVVLHCHWYDSLCNLKTTISFLTRGQSIIF